MMKSEPHQENVPSPHLWVTWGLISVIACVYVWMYETSPHIAGGFSRSDLVVWGAIEPVAVWSGEVWRLVTAIFLHGNWIHALLNTVVLFQVGRLLEPVLGSSRFLFVFLVAGIVGFASGLILHGFGAVGASGGIFGLVGALLGVMIFLPKEIIDQRLLRSLFWFVGLNVALGFAVNWGFGTWVLIDNMAHLGGLVSGLFIGIAFVTDTPWFAIFRGHERIKRQRASRLALVVSYALLFTSVGYSIKPVFSNKYRYQMGLFALVHQDLDRANKLAEELLRSANSSGLGYVLKGRIAVHNQREDEANHSFNRALAAFDGDVAGAWKVIFQDGAQSKDLNEQLFADERSNAVLCEAAVGKLAASPGADIILNDCAWLLLMARDAQVHNAKRALEWVKMAVRHSKSNQPEVLHTLAEAYSQNGRLDEAVVAMDRAIVQAGPKANQFFVAERERFLRLN